MIPIGIMSLMVVTLAVERMIHLRKECLLPRNLERELTLLNSPPETFNPSAALKAAKSPLGEFPNHSIDAGSYGTVFT